MFSICLNLEIKFKMAENYWITKILQWDFEILRLFPRQFFIFPERYFDTNYYYGLSRNVSPERAGKGASLTENSVTVDRSYKIFYV